MAGDPLSTPLLADSSTPTGAAGLRQHQQQQQQQQQKPLWTNTALGGFAVLCFSFFLLFGALCPLQNLMSSALARGGLGATSIGLSFVLMFFGSFAAPAVIARLGAPRTLLLSSVAIPTYCAANIAPSWTSLVPASVALGLGDSALWVACGEVMTLLAADFAAAAEADKDRTIGFFNSVFWTCFQLANLSGNGVMSVLLTRGERPDSESASNAEMTTLRIGFTCCALGGTALLSLLPGSAQPRRLLPVPLVPGPGSEAGGWDAASVGGGSLSTSSLGPGRESQGGGLLTVMEGEGDEPAAAETPPAGEGRALPSAESGSDGGHLGRWLSQSQGVGGDEVSTSASGRTPSGSSVDAAAVAAALADGRQQHRGAVPLPALLAPLLPLFLYSGAEGAFAWSVFTKQVITPTLGMDEIGAVFVLNGAVNGLASLLLSGRGVRSVCLILAAGAVAHGTVFRWLTERSVEGVVEGLSRRSLFIAAGALGFGDAVCNTQIGTLLGILVPPGSLKVAFAVWKGLFSLACGAVFFAEPYVDLRAPLAVMQCLLVAAATGLAFAATRALRNEKPQRLR